MQRPAHPPGSNFFLGRARLLQREVRRQRRHSAELRTEFLQASEVGFSQLDRGDFLRAHLRAQLVHAQIEDIVGKHCVFLPVL